VAILIHSLSGRRIVLLPQHVFGRDRSASTVLDGEESSRLHASIRWTGQTWEVRDHSRNGTLVDGRRISPSGAVALKAGQTLAFGSDGSTTWTVQDLGRPGPVLLDLDGQASIALSSANLLPDDEAAELSIVQDVDGAWQSSSAEGRQALRDGDELVIRGRRWRFYSGAGQVTVEVPAGATPAACAAHFDVSLDEEHVMLRLIHRGREVDLGERTHHYVLLTLARLRRDDTARGLAPPDQGWVYQDRLAKMLGLDPAHLNIQIFRLRRQLSQALGPGVTPPALIQRRRGALRAGDLILEIRRGDR
jgi:hypothetical protein